ncbi:methyltransferase N6AMT1 [Trichonephila clavipes]|nr:methyltransferase N6AMT1 [Trichonephila clavipes]
MVSVLASFVRLEQKQNELISFGFLRCTDLNPIAANATKATSQRNGVPVDVITSNLVCVLEDRLKSSVDLIVCNPPYAVTPSDEVGGNNTFKATSGGVKGREVIDQILHIVPKLLSEKGLFYLTCIAQNDIDDISQCMKAHNLQMTKVLERHCGIEHLFTLRFSYKNYEL